MSIATATPVVDTETIDVIAPTTLQEGATFEAVVDGITFIATVPCGGVQGGDTFPVPYPSAAPFTATASRGEFLVPNGEWRTGLCDCCDSTRGCCILLLCGSFCNLCLHAQIMQRLKLNLAGFPAKPGIYGRVYRLFLGITFGLIALYYFMTVLQFYDGALLLLYCLSIWQIFALVAFTCTRRHMREKYNLPANCCKGCGACDDFATTYFCMCCSAIQMASHTHDRNVYPYSCCSETGLADYAPEIADSYSYECSSETDLTTYPPEIV